MENLASHRRCPYAVRGVDSPAMAGCPGYAPDVVPVGAERIVGFGLSCRHLRAQCASGRPGAFISACTHPLLGVPENGNGVSPGR